MKVALQQQQQNRASGSSWQGVSTNETKVTKLSVADNSQAFEGWNPKIPSPFKGGGGFEWRRGASKLGGASKGGGVRGASKGGGGFEWRRGFRNWEGLRKGEGEGGFEVGRKGGFEGGREGEGGGGGYDVLLVLFGLFFWKIQK